MYKCLNVLMSKKRMQTCFEYLSKKNKIGTFSFKVFITSYEFKSNTANDFSLPWPNDLKY